MDTIIFDYILDNLQASKGRWAHVAAGSGVPLRTLGKIARREIKDPGIMHCERLAAYFRRMESLCK